MMPKQVVLARFEAVVAVLALRNPQNAVKIGCFGPKSGSKMVKRAGFDHILSNFCPSQGQKRLEKVPLWDHGWLKNGSRHDQKGQFFPASVGLESSAG